MQKKAPWTFRCRPRSQHFNVEGSSWRRSYFFHGQFVLNIEVWGAGSDFERQGAFFSQTPVSIFHCQFAAQPPRLTNDAACSQQQKRLPKAGDCMGALPQRSLPPLAVFALVSQTVSETNVPSTIATKQMKTMKTMRTIPENHSYLHENHEIHEIHTFL